MRETRARRPADGPQGHRAPRDLQPDLRRIVTLDIPESQVYRAAPRLPNARYRPVPGWQRYCPVCGGRFRAFDRFGLAGRRQARCPGCGSLERHRFLWLYLRQALKLPHRRLSLLHIAPEPCLREVFDRAPSIDYIAVDRYASGPATHMDIEAMRFSDARFDAVLCSHVLEHVADDRRAIREIGRVLKPRGRAIVLVPLDRARETTLEDPTATTAAARQRRFGHPYHRRVCGRDYIDRLAEGGFDVHPVDSAALSGHRRRFHRINKLILFDCHRTPATPSSSKTK